MITSSVLSISAKSVSTSVVTALESTV